MSDGDKVKVHGKNVCTIVRLNSTGKRALVTGEYDGWTKVADLVAVTA